MADSKWTVLWVCCLLFGCTTQNLDSANARMQGCTQCSLTDDSNFSFTSEIRISGAVLQAGQDATVDWSAMTTDIQGHPMSPEDVHQVALLVFNDLSEVQVEKRLAEDNLHQSDIALYLLCETDEDDSLDYCNLSDFGILNSTIDVGDAFLEGTGTWLLALQNDDHQGALGLMFIEPRVDSLEDMAAFVDGGSSLDITIDLQTLKPHEVSSSDPITVDWSQLSVDGLGNPLSLHNIDTLSLARYEASLESLEAKPFDLWNEADDYWTVTVTGQQSIDLKDLNGEAPFGGIEPGWTWLLALECSTCTNPMPKFVTVLQPM